MIVPQMCQYGKYLDPSNTVNPGCVACPEDKFCWTDAIILTDITANTDTAGACPAGYKCISGANHTVSNYQSTINP